MAIQITIRNVPDAVRNELAARAARRGQSIQQFRVQPLEQIVETPSIEELIAEIEQRQETADDDIPVDSILEELDDDRI